MKIVKFIWDHSEGNPNHVGTSLHICHLLPNRFNPEVSHLENYGISLSIPDFSKDFALTRYSNYRNYIKGEVVEVTKEEARESLMAQIDKALDVLFNQPAMKRVEEFYNIDPNPIEDAD